MLLNVAFHLLICHEVDIDGALGVRLDEIVGAMTGLALLAVHLGVGEGSGVPARFPDA